MLKITAIDNEHQRTLVLEGRLVDPWVSELERTWNEAQMSNPPRLIVVDMKDVTAISQGGENLLLQMMAGGATFNCCRGVLTKRVVQRLKRRCKAQARRGEYGKDDITQHCL